MTKSEVLKTKEVANTRIHVVRAIGQMKRFSILTELYPYHWSHWLMTFYCVGSSIQPIAPSSELTSLCCTVVTNASQQFIANNYDII